MIPIPPTNDPRWTDVFRQNKTFRFEFLAANMVFTRLAIEARRDPSEQNLHRLATEFREIFDKNAHNPKVQNDVQKIFGRAK